MMQDISSRADCERLVQEAASALGGLDVVIANAAWTTFSDFADLSALSEEEWDKCWATNVKSSLHLFRAAKDMLTANPDGGAYIYTASIAGVSPSGSSMAYSVTKAAGLHLMKCLAQSQGPKIRVNSVTPGLLLTDWGQRYSSEYIQRWRDETPLREVPDVRQCAEIYLSVARNRSMTGQQIEIDCGWLLSH
jgi:NAD(P)-dependent dehydrogenase (short-subunit alcohol dehydrogenase family)